MKARDLFYIVRRNLLRMKLRVAMTATGVLIGTTAVVLVVSLGIGLQRANTESMSSYLELTELQVYSPGVYMGGMPANSRDMPVLNAKTLREFKQIPGVIAVTPLMSSFGTTLRWKRLAGGANLVGIDPVEVERLGFELASGAPRLGQFQVIAGAQVANSLMDPRTGRGPQARPELQGQVLLLILSKTGEDGETIERQVRARVAGVLAETGGQKDYSLYLSAADVLDLEAWVTGRRANYARDGYMQALVKTANAQSTLAVEQAIEQQGFYVYSLQSMLQENNILFMVIQAVLGGLGGIALLVAGFGIANAMVMAIYERTREIGLMKAVGATNREVLFIFLAEAGCIGLLGGLSGLLVGWLGGAALNFIARAYITSMVVQQGGSADNIPGLVYTPLWLALSALAFSFLIGVASGIYPALRATRLDPIQALRYE